MDYAIIRKIVRDCFRVDRIDYEPSSVLSVAHDNDRSLLHKGKFYSPLIDTIEDDLAARGLRCLSVARVISAIKGELSYGRVRSPEGAFARALVQKRLRGLVMRGRYPYSSMEERAWADILERTGARKVFGIQPSRELCAACHDRGIWVADVQHGVIAQTHPWYGASFRGNDPVRWLPHAFLLWDQGSADVVEPWARAKGIDMPVIGNRWLARFARPRPDDELVAELSKDYNQRDHGDARRKTILVSLSWGEDNIPNGFIDEGLERTIRDTAADIRWLIRLHPNQVRGFATHEGPKFADYFERRLRGYAEWELATSAPLPVILHHIDLHITWQSSVCIEAAQMGIKSALLNPKMRMPGVRDDYYGHYKAAGRVEFIGQSESEISDWIQRNLDSKLDRESYEAFDSAYSRLLDFLAEPAAT